MNYLTAGESHGPQLTGILEGIPSGSTLILTKLMPNLKKTPRWLWPGQPAAN